MPDISPKIDTHQLKIDLDVQPVREKKKRTLAMSGIRIYFFLFFKTLRSMTTFEWTEDCQKAFEELKTHLLSPKILPQSRENEDLFLYLGVADLAISSLLVIEDAGVLHDAETR